MTLEEMNVLQLIATVLSCSDQAIAAWEILWIRHKEAYQSEDWQSLFYLNHGRLREILEATTGKIPEIAHHLEGILYGNDGD